MVGSLVKKTNNMNQVPPEYKSAALVLDPYEQMDGEWYSDMNSVTLQYFIIP
jgi:hypothetical protein